MVFFEAIEISGQTLAKNLTKVLDNYALKRKIIAYVKDEGSNLNIVITTLKSIISCDVLGLFFFFFRALVLVMHFLKHANMEQHMKKFAKTYDMHQSKLPKDICINA